MGNELGSQAHWRACAATEAAREGGREKRGAPRAAAGGGLGSRRLSTTACGVLVCGGGGWSGGEYVASPRESLSCSRAACCLAPTVQPGFPLPLTEAGGVPRVRLGPGADKAHAFVGA